MPIDYCENCEQPVNPGCRHMYGDQPQCKLGPRTDPSWIVGKAIWDNLCDRRGIKNVLQGCDPTVQVSIIEDIGDIAVRISDAEREACAKIADLYSLDVLSGLASANCKLHRCDHDLCVTGRKVAKAAKKIGERIRARGGR